MLRCFNSRTREGCDRSTLNKQFRKLLFQFTHPRGVRLSRCSLLALKNSFQFTHPRGVRLQGWGGGCGAASTDLL